MRIGVFNYTRSCRKRFERRRRGDAANQAGGSRSTVRLKLSDTREKCKFQRQPRLTITNEDRFSIETDFVVVLDRTCILIKLSLRSIIRYSEFISRLECKVTRSE